MELRGEEPSVFAVDGKNQVIGPANAGNSISQKREEAGIRLVQVGNELVWLFTGQAGWLYHLIDIEGNAGLSAAMLYFNVRIL